MSTRIPSIGRPVNWYGSKDKMAARIHALMPPGPDTWVDLFCGSAIVTLRKVRHRREVINDLNGDVVNLFDVLRDDWDRADLFRRLELTPYAESLLERVYREPAPAGDRVGKAWHFLVRSWFGRGGDGHETGFRWSKNQTTAPELSWVRLPERLELVAERLRGVCIRCDDALKILGDYDHPDCLIYVDPPYPGPVGRRYEVRMTADQHRALARRLKACRARVILSMNPGTVYSEVLSDWIETRVQVLGGGNKSKAEVLLTNYEPLPLLAGGEVVA